MSIRLGDFKFCEFSFTLFWVILALKFSYLICCPLFPSQFSFSFFRFRTCWCRSFLSKQKVIFFILFCLFLYFFPGANKLFSENPYFCGIFLCTCPTSPRQTCIFAFLSRGITQTRNKCLIEFVSSGN